MSNTKSTKASASDKNADSLVPNFHRPFRFFYVIKDVGEVYFGSKPKLKKSDNLFFTGFLIPTFANHGKIIYRLVPDEMPAVADMSADEKKEYYRTNYKVLVSHINLRLSVYLQLPTNIVWSDDM